MNFTCIAADLDGTLLDKQKRVSSRTVEVLARLAAAGIPFIPATGRPFFAIPQQILQLPGVRYAVSSNGSAVYDAAAQKPVCALHLPAEFVPCLLDAMRDEAVEYECMYAGRPYIAADVYARLLTLQPNAGATQYIRDTRTPLADLESFLRAHAHALEAVELYLDPRRQDAIRAKIEACCPPVYITTSNPARLEISHIESGKHRGIERACALLGADAAGLLAFGDQDNDIEMLTHAALGVAVANAAPGCRAAAGLVCPSNEEDGVAQALIRLFPALFT